MPKLTTTQEALESFIAAEENAPTSKKASKTNAQAASNVAAMSGDAQRAGLAAANTGAAAAQTGKTVAQEANQIMEIGERAREEGERVTNWASTLSTPGGILVLLVIVVAIIWILVPVNNGLTRAQLLYLTLMGKTRIARQGDAGSQSGIGTIPPIEGLQYTVAQGSSPAVSQTSSQATPVDYYNSPGAIQSLSNVNGTGYIPDFGVSL